MGHTQLAKQRRKEQKAQAKQDLEKAKIEKFETAFAAWALENVPKDGNMKAARNHFFWNIYEADNGTA